MNQKERKYGKLKSLIFSNVRDGQFFSEIGIVSDVTSADPFLCCVIAEQDANFKKNNKKGFSFGRKFHDKRNFIWCLT